MPLPRSPRLWLSLGACVWSLAACVSKSGSEPATSTSPPSAEPAANGSASPEPATTGTETTAKPIEGAPDRDPDSDEAGASVTPTAPVSGLASKVIFLHHSTGGVIWEAGVERWFERYNTAHGTSYEVRELFYPGYEDPWANYPHEYVQHWVLTSGDKMYRDQPTLEMLARDHGVVVFKHCFPASMMYEHGASVTLSSEEKALDVFKLQYDALKKKMRELSGTKFIVWTAPAMQESTTNLEQAQIAKRFAEWVLTSWDEPGDNIFVWDFRKLETNGTYLFLPQANARAKGDDHPADAFAEKTAPLFAQRIVDVIEGRGDTGKKTGE
jgi:hypothetical protein